MAAACMKDKQPFGVCLIASGKEVGAAAVPHPVGTLAHIDHADMPQLGILLLKVRGGRRFRIVSQTAQSRRPVARAGRTARRAGEQAVPAAQQGLLPLLRKIVGDLGPDKMPPPHAFDDAAWVGYRLTEIVSVQMLAKQKLLELDDPVSRLEILHTYFTPAKSGRLSRVRPAWRTRRSTAPAEPACRPILAPASPLPASSHSSVL